MGRGTPPRSARASGEGQLSAGPMAFSLRLAEQLARPHGLAGQLLGSAMDIANRRPTRLAIDLLGPRGGEAVLDAGCGTGLAIAEVLRRAPCRVTGIDPSPTMVRNAEARLARHRAAGMVRIIPGRIEDMCCADAGFDAVLALNVLYFCDAEGRMAERLARSIRPGGRLVAYVTHGDTMRNWAFAREGIHRLFDSGSLKSLLADAGFASARTEVQEIPVTRSVLGLFAHAER